MRIGALVLSVFVNLGAAAATAQSGDAASVRAAFEGYRSALEARDGGRAAGLVTDETLEFYEACRRAALSMPRVELERRDFVFRYVTLQLRNELDADLLGAMSGRDVFARAVAEGQVGSNLSAMEIVGAEARGDRGRVRLRPPAGERTRVELQRQRDAWRVDVRELIRRTAPQMGRVAERMGDGDENAGLLAILSLASPRPVPASIWDPLRP